jgi:hypothetical protein
MLDRKVVIASAAKQSRAAGAAIPGLLRRYAPRDDELMTGGNE